MDIDVHLKAIDTREQAYEFANWVIPPETPLDYRVRKMLGLAITKELEESGYCDGLQVELRLIEMEIDMVDHRDAAEAIQVALSRWCSHNEGFTIHGPGECKQWVRSLVAVDKSDDEVRTSARLMEKCAAPVIEERGVCTSKQLASELTREWILADEFAAGAFIARFVMKGDTGLMPKGWTGSKGLTH